MSTSDKIKLRNKNTGEIREFDGLGGFMLSDDYPNHYLEDKIYDSLAKLNEEWEDYEPAKPYIENEKARKIVRVWAECCGAQVVHHYLCDGCSCFMFTDEKGNDCCLDFTFRINNLESNEDYTIDELCREEEE